MTEYAASRRGDATECEAALIRRLQHRDAEALGELYDLCGRLSYSLIVRIVRDGVIAEDLVQETFLCVWRRISLFDSEKGALVPWLLTIARNRALDHLRSRKRRTLSLEAIEDPRLFVGIDRDLDRIASIPHRIALQDALQKLTENQRKIIDLAYFEGYSQTEIAARLGHPPGTIKTWVRSALQILRNQLQPSACRPIEVSHGSR